MLFTLLIVGFLQFSKPEPVATFENVTPVSPIPVCVQNCNSPQLQGSSIKLQ